MSIFKPAQFDERYEKMYDDDEPVEEEGEAV